MEKNYLFLFILLIVVLIAAFYWVKNNSMLKLIKSTDTSRIAHVRLGFYEIKGKVVALEPPLISPFSEKPCVYYNFRVEQKRSNGKSSSWVKILGDIKSQKFGIDDGSGIAAIDMKSATIELKTDNRENSGIFNNATPHQQRVLEKYGKQSHGWLFEKNLRYFETILEEGDEVYAIGEVSGKEGNYPLFKKGEKPFFVSDRPEEDLISRFQNSSYVSIAVMVVAALGALFLIFN